MSLSIINDESNTLILRYCNLKTQKYISFTSKYQKNLNNDYHNLRIKDLILTWSCKVKLSRFQILDNCNQKIREIVPVMWLLNTAFNNNKNRQKARESVGKIIEDKFCFIYNDNKDIHISYNLGLENKEISLEMTKEYTRVQYWCCPNKTIIEYFNEINKTIRIDLFTEDILNNIIKESNYTLPELMLQYYTYDDLSWHGY
jgi:hypothetical protein